MKRIVTVLMATLIGTFGMSCDSGQKTATTNRNAAPEIKKGIVPKADSEVAVIEMGTDRLHHAPAENRGPGVVDHVPCRLPRDEIAIVEKERDDALAAAERTRELASEEQRRPERIAL